MSDDLEYVVANAWSIACIAFFATGHWIAGIISGIIVAFIQSARDQE